MCMGFRALGLPEVMQKRSSKQSCWWSDSRDFDHGSWSKSSSFDACIQGTRFKTRGNLFFFYFSGQKNAEQMVQCYE